MYLQSNELLLLENKQKKDRPKIQGENHTYENIGDVSEGGSNNDKIDIDWK
jgi:hypothetical protein